MAGEKDESFAERLQARHAEGYRMMKLEAAHYETPALLAARVAAIRRQAGKDLRLVLDFAWSWPSVEHGLKCAAPLRDLDIDWLEDPFHRDRVADYAAVKAGARIPIGAGDETTQDRRTLRLIESTPSTSPGSTPPPWGGFGPAEQGARAAAAARGMRISFHERPEVHQHLAFGLGLADHVEVFPTDRPFDCAHNVIREPAFDRISKGSFPHDRAGQAGLKLDDKALARSAQRNGKVAHG